MNISKPAKPLVSLNPNFSAQDIEYLKLYFVMNQKYQEEINLRFRKDFENHIFWGPFLKSMPEDIQKQRNEISQKLLYNAIYKNDWDAYTQDLIMQGVFYANMGVTFSMWHEIIAVVKDYMTPYILKNHGDSVEKTVGVLNAMGKLMDFAMQGIAESYLIEKNKVMNNAVKK